MLGIDTLTVGVPLSIVTAEEFLKQCLYFTEEEAKDCLRQMIIAKAKYKSQLCDMKYLRRLIEYGKYMQTKKPIKYIRFAYFKNTMEFCLLICVSPFEVVYCRKAKPNELFTGSDEEVADFNINMADIIARICWNVNYSENADIRTEFRSKMFFNKMYLLRIDYTCNLVTEKEKVPLYISLYNSTVLEKHNFKRSNKYKQNCVRVKNKQTAVILYDKEAQIKNCSPEYAKEAEGIIRFEVQHKKSAKIRNLKKEYGGLNLNLLYREVALAQLLYYWCLLLPEGDFYKWNALIKKLDCLGLTNSQKEKIIDVFIVNQNSHSVATARNSFKLKSRFNFKSEAKAKAAFDKRIKATSALGIAPYAVPVEKSVKYGIHKYDYGSCLPSLFPQIA